jgi:hypothetical protein
VSPVKYELCFYIPEDDILHSHRRENLKSYIVTVHGLRPCKQRRVATGHMHVCTLRTQLSVTEARRQWIRVQGRVIVRLVLLRDLPQLPHIQGDYKTRLVVRATQTGVPEPPGSGLWPSSGNSEYQKK